jgi:subtilase family serine protease
MLNRIFTFIAIFTVVAITALGQRPPVNIKGRSAGQPDLQVREYQFSPGNDKAMKVHVTNTGAAASALCVLRLTIRKINGVSVGRTTEVKLPAIAAGGDKWIAVDAKSILPNNVSLESTTFKLNADASEIIAESNESNNELWHNL